MGLRWALLNTELNPWFPIQHGSFLDATYDLSISFPRRTLSIHITSRWRQNVLKAKLQTMHLRHFKLYTYFRPDLQTISPHPTPLLAKTELTVVQTAQKINSRTLLLRVPVLLTTPHTRWLIMHACVRACYGPNIKLIQATGRRWQVEMQH
jgi:hypothetical protein